LKLINFKNGEIKNFFNPTYCYFIGEDILPIDTEALSQFLLLKEKELIKKYPSFNDGGTSLGDDSVTARYMHYNLLQFPETSYLKKYIRNTHDKFIKSLNQSIEQNYYVQCWFNIMREGEQIKKHNHSSIHNSYLSGHICVKVKNTNTYYETPYYKDEFPSKNLPGKITLFPDWITHYTDKVSSSEERITIAFDIRNEKLYVKYVKDFMKPHWVKI